jgi:predicted SAM-dependent methyltransferase
MTKLHVLVVLQTHSKGDNQHYLGLTKEERFCKAPKAEVTRRCTRSLVQSLNYAKELFINSEFELVVYDDHSDDQSVIDIKNNLNLANFKTQFIPLDTHGIMPSILKCYEHGRDHGKEIVYFAQDDYLYDTTAIYDMIETMMDTSMKLGNFVSVYPYDDPYKYIPENANVSSHIIRWRKRHWRTQIMTASCFMTHHKIITDNWDLFEAMGKHEVDRRMEDNTINQLFRTRGYHLIVPIPSLALHMQYQSEIDDQINWREWWDKYDRASPFVNTTSNTILNVGFGGQHIKEMPHTEPFNGMKELTLDIDNKFNPDIMADITDISHIPNNYVTSAYTSHMIEHIDYFKVPLVLRELLRICQPGGIVRIVTPNLQVIGEHISKGDLLTPIYDSNGGPISPIDIIYGHRHSVHRNRVDFMIHRTGFTKQVFEHIATENNFDIDIKEIDFDLIVDIKKH